MTAGIISRATEDVIQFDGMTIGGSSGSPLLNANGEVIAIHRAGLPQAPGIAIDRKSTRLNSSHLVISYAVFCLKKKKKKRTTQHAELWSGKIAELSHLQ